MAKRCCRGDQKIFSDLDTFAKGDQIYYEGKYYQATGDLKSVTDEGEEAISTEILQRIRFLSMEEFIPGIDKCT